MHDNTGKEVNLDGTQILPSRQPSFTTHWNFANPVTHGTDQLQNMQQHKDEEEQMEMGNRTNTQRQTFEDLLLEAAVIRNRLRGKW
jgi:hypothetical protein